MSRPWSRRGQDTRNPGSGHWHVRVTREDQISDVRAGELENNRRKRKASYWSKGSSDALWLAALDPSEFPHDQWLTSSLATRKQCWGLSLAGCSLITRHLCQGCSFTPTPNVTPVFLCPNTSPRSPRKNSAKWFPSHHEPSHWHSALPSFLLHCNTRFKSDVHKTFLASIIIVFILLTSSKLPKEIF